MAETVDVTFRLSKELAEQLESLGWVEDSAFVERTLRAELKRDLAWKNLQEFFRQADADPEQMTLEEVVAEIKKYRAEKRAREQRE